MKKNNIKVAAASVTGPMHQTKILPCQDYYRYSKSGTNFVAIVSDGAGSAKFGKIGARIVCDTVIDLLKNTPYAKAQQTIVKAIEVARDKLVRHRLNVRHDEQGIADFAATVVGLVYRNGKGMFFHIGDGAGVAFLDDDYQNFTASPPENGTFSCETFFYTQDTWTNNLRFTPFQNANTIFLMSDGVTNFSFTPDYRNIEKGFILPINNFLSSEPSQAKAERALVNTLNTPQAKRLNSDDKTIIWAKL